MKKCPNCFEQNSDGANDCIVCGEPLLPIQEKEATETQSALDALVKDHFADGMAQAEMPAPKSEEVTKPKLAPPLPQTALPPIPPALPEPQKDEEEEPSPVQNESVPDSTATPTPVQNESVSASLVAPKEEVPIQREEDHVQLGMAAQAELQVFHDTDAVIVHRHAVVNDVTLVGREDAGRDIFPDLDIGKLTGKGVSATSVSRKHFRLIRQGQFFSIYVFPGTTGTQLNKEVLEDDRHGKRIDIHVGDRLVLGGKVRMKLAPR